MDTAMFEKALKDATAEGGILPGLAIIVADDQGNIKYSNSCGNSPTGPVTVDSTMWFASCTKLMGTIAALQCVEKGLIALDDPVGGILPALADPDVLEGFDETDNKPILRKAKNKITLRQLLTHSSGHAYPTSNPLLAKYIGAELGSIDKITATTDVSKYALPLVYEPGEGFTYGYGIDWAGKAVENLTGISPLGDYMKENIWKPLGMEHTTFRLPENQAVREKMIGTVTRDSNGRLIPCPCPWPQTTPIDDCAGAGTFSCPSDFIKILISLLKNDGKLLKPATVDEMFKPNLPDNKYLMGLLNIPQARFGFTAGSDAGKQWNWGLGGLLAMEDIPGHWSEGTLAWGGLPNIKWWIDRKRGTCAISAMQLVPQGDREAILFHKEKVQKMVWNTIARHGD
ncbi:hypothetical protein ACJ72_05062 [Emergomyces africanus]|uniref:Beta-lactamase-related domain-containing protein n=1 Tax=Emergomyces africanus TaxID=1955775 RepID=A0A1B7NV16_9EURO|nr:hypothetical protein ACJ72_05062 [Emergomyces africanus]